MECHDVGRHALLPLKCLGEEIPCPSNFRAGNKKLTSMFIQCEDVVVARDCAPIKVDWPHNSNSGIDERAIGKSYLCYY